MVGFRALVATISAKALISSLPNLVLQTISAQQLDAFFTETEHQFDTSILKSTGYIKSYTIF